MYNLRNRSFLKEIDFSAQELEHLAVLERAAPGRGLRLHAGRDAEDAGVQLVVAGQVDPAEGALAQQPLHPVAADRLG